MNADHLDNDFRRHAHAAHHAIDRRVTDACRHAYHGDLATAGSRFDELRDVLLAPGGILDRARRETFRRSFGHHQRTLPESIRRTDLHYHRDLEDVAATAPIRDHDAAAEITRLIREAADTLPLLHAAYPVGSDTREPVFRDWAARHGDGLKAAAKRLISDAQMTIFHQSQVFLTKPEMRS